MGCASSALATLGLGLASVLLILLCAETYFRLLAPQRGDPGMFEPHPQLGWLFAPDRRSAYVVPGLRAHHVRTNRDGFRDAPFEQDPPEAQRIAVLGDSFVSNLAVQGDEVFTEVMERQLPGVSVMNLGVNGYGQAQQYLLLGSVLRDLAPDLVVVVIYLRNDFTDNTGIGWGARGRRPIAVLDATQEQVRIRRPQVVEAEGLGEAPSGLDRLHVTRFVSDRLARRLRPARAARGDFVASAGTPPELYLTAREPTPETRRLYRVMELLLQDIAGLAARHDVPIVFALAPSMAQVIPEVWQTVLERSEADPADFDLEIPSRRLSAFGKARGVRIVDLLPALRAAHAAGTATYHLVEQHWTPGGNRVVAETLLDWIQGDPELRNALGLASAGG